MGHCASRLNLVEVFQPERRRVRELESQLRSNERELRRLRDQLRELQQNRDPSRDWVIYRNEIQIMRELGRGAWGVVYLGRFHGCEVAVKQMHREIISDRNRRVFEREVDIASKCRHPCLLQFIGATADNQTPLLVTELMECSLRERICSITAVDVTVICLDVARALNYLHQKPRPIIHHDVSSANVLLRHQRNQWQAKLSDYGTANFVRQSNINYAGAWIYCAPESGREDPDRPISVKVDVYSFGVLLCEMCIRQDPDPNRRREQIRQMRESRFQNLVERCIHEHPGMRPNMDTIIEQLESLRVRQLRMARTGRPAWSSRHFFTSLM